LKTFFLSIIYPDFAESLRILIQVATDPKHPNKWPHFPPYLQNKERDKNILEELQPVIPNGCF
jgi:hypothetical protein